MPPFAIATSLVKPSAIAHLSALAHHDLTDQIPRVVSAITPRKVVVPSMRGARKGPEDQHVWRVTGLDLRYVVVIPERFELGIEMIWLDERFRIPITDRERTVLDLFAMPFGTVRSLSRSAWGGVWRPLAPATRYLPLFLS